MKTSIKTLATGSKKRAPTFLLLLIGMLLDLGADCAGVDYCYSDIGCFPLSPEFYHPRHRPFNVRPWHRNRIRTSFELYNRNHQHGFQLRPWNKLNLRASGFNPMLETKIIIPGWVDHLKRTLWMRRMRDAFLWLWSPVNIIIVHWRNFTPYTIATANTRVVGAELANLLRFIERELHYDRSYYHLIGHSLGAHIAGYCGDRIAGLGRITALDPARPFFQGMPKSVRLDRADARFVDAIHSDFTPENAIFLLMSFGMTSPVGHVDFYPNGPPLLQPGCLRDTLQSAQNGIRRGIQHSSLSMAFLETFRYMTACDHQRSHEWFVESITNRKCQFIGVRCNQYEGLINGRCTCDDSRSACAIMGIHADQMYLQNAHEDLWPWTARSNGQIARPDRLRSAVVRSSAAPLLNEQSPQHLQQVDRPSMRTRDQVYARLKQTAQQLRKPPLPMLLLPQQYDIVSDFEYMKDAHLHSYLKSTFLRDTSDGIQGAKRERRGRRRRRRRRSTSRDQHPLVRPHLQASHDPDDVLDNELLEGEDEISSTFENDQTMTEFFVNHQLPGHPRLLSDIDRDIESWYEGSSRWYLKTNHRPNFCMNQYQVLVFLGPLRSRSAKRRIRANLIISIIGSRGQLINQRFVPRSSSLDSFTMQPFFILLEGSYSLGSILSVAVGWEARLEPDPIQATVSFHSNLLESLQAAGPSFTAKHPWLSETLKYDFSDAFTWRHNQQFLHQLGWLYPPNGRLSSPDDPLALGSTLVHPYGSLVGSKGRLERSLDGDETRYDYSSEPNGSGGQKKRSQCNDRKGHVRLKSANLYLDQLLAGEKSLISFSEGRSLDRLANEGDLKSGPHQQPPPTSQDNIAQSSHQVVSIVDFHKHNELLDSLRELNNAADTAIKAELHNIPMHLDADLEDSIIVNQVQVNPIEASYGRKATKSGKLFCPPDPNHRLRRDQTLRLAPSLLDKCHSSGARTIKI